MNGWLPEEVAESWSFQTIGWLGPDNAIVRALARAQIALSAITGADGLTGVGLIELTDDVVQRRVLGRHRKEFDAGLVAHIRTGAAADAAHAEELEVGLSLDIDGKNPDVTRGHRRARFQVAPRPAHVVDADALTADQDGTTRRGPGRGHQCFQSFDGGSSCASMEMAGASAASAGATSSSSRQHSLPPTDTRVLDVTFA